MTQEGFDITERIRGEKTMSKNYKFETLQVHAGQEHPDPANRCESSADLCNNILCIQRFRAGSRTFRN